MIIGLPRVRSRRFAIGDAEYIPPSSTDAETKKVLASYAKASASSIDDVKDRYATLRPQKDIAQEFEKSYQLAVKGAELASSWPNWNVFTKALPEDKKAEAAKIKTDLESARSYWATQGRTNPKAVSRPSAKQQAMGVAPYIWVDWVTKYTVVTTSARADTVKSVADAVKNSPSAVVKWAGDQAKKGLGIPDWVFKVAIPVGLGLVALTAVAYGYKTLKTVLPRRETQ